MWNVNSGILRKRFIATNNFKYFSYATHVLQILESRG